MWSYCELLSLIVRSVHVTEWWPRCRIPRLVPHIKILKHVLLQEMNPASKDDLRSIISDHAPGQVHPTVERESLSFVVSLVYLGETRSWNLCRKFSTRIRLHKYWYRFATQLHFQGRQSGPTSTMSLFNIAWPCGDCIEHHSEGIGEQSLSS